MKYKFLYLFVSVMTFLTLTAQNNAIKVGADGKSWEIATRSSGYRLEVTGQNELIQGIPT